MNHKTFRTRISPFIILLLTLGVACGGGDAPDNNTAPAASDDRPEITEETIKEHLVGEFLRRIPAADGSKQTSSWSFQRNEPKTVQIVEKKVESESAVVVIDIKTGSHPDNEDKIELWGQLRLHYQLESGWVLRQWEIRHIDNLSFVFKREPRPNASPSPSPAASKSPSPSPSKSPSSSASASPSR